ncbi:MAG TPA: DNA polymerase IV [Casimicrobiaceae bacterium]|nr:DNA polymerase IV [Casimicrobiaceae bacterium]
MDAFYASVELLRYPDLAGQAVVIGGGRQSIPQESVDPATGAVTRRYQRLASYAGRGVITTATYAARKLGVGSAMGLMKAAKLAPDAILLPADFDAYRTMSRKFKAAVRAIAPVVEDHGIDEIYIDLTGVRLPGHEGEPEDDADAWWRARDVARALKAAVREATGLTCSVAVAPNKLLAKIASELDKPDGLTVVRDVDLPTLIWPLPAKRINGIGPKAAARLERLGIATIGELAWADRRKLEAVFGGGYARWMIDAANGRDERPVVTESEPRSISRETTFERDLSATRDRAELSRIFTWLCERVADDLVRKGYAGRTIGVKLRFDDFATVTRDYTVDAPTQDAKAIRRAAGECLKRVPLQRRIRLLGVRIGHLSPAAPPGAHAA